MEFSAKFVLPEEPCPYAEGLIGIISTGMITETEINNVLAALLEPLQLTAEVQRALAEGNLARALLVKAFKPEVENSDEPTENNEGLLHLAYEQAATEVVQVNAQIVEVEAAQAETALVAALGMLGLVQHHLRHHQTPGTDCGMS